MRIVSCDPALTELVSYFDLGESLVGASHLCGVTQGKTQLPSVTYQPHPGEQPKVCAALFRARSARAIDFEVIRSLSPEIILAQVPGVSRDEHFLSKIKEELRSGGLSEGVKFFAYDPHSLESLYEFYETVGRDLGARAKGHTLAQKVKAQIMDWCDNFYERTKSKKVSFLSAIDPMRLAGGWVSDVVHLASAVSHSAPGGEEYYVSWEDIIKFRPDVIIVAPQGQDLKTSMQLFKELEKLKGWQDVPAVKRGEVVFAEGISYFYEPGPHILDSFAILISAIAGFESGYITPRDTFYRLRWLELQRHRF